LQILITTFKGAIMKTKLVIDQSRLLGFKLLGVKVAADSKDKHSILGAKIGKPGNVPIIVGAKIGKVGKAPAKVPSR